MIFYSKNLQVDLQFVLCGENARTNKKQMTMKKKFDMGERRDKNKGMCKRSENEEENWKNIEWKKSTSVQEDETQEKRK